MKITYFLISLNILFFGLNLTLGVFWLIGKVVNLHAVSVEFLLFCGVRYASAEFLAETVPFSCAFVLWVTAVIILGGILKKRFFGDKAKPSESGNDSGDRNL